MFISAFRFSYINSKLHSLKSMLLKQSDYKNLIQTQGFNGFVEYLKPTSYGKDLDESIHSYDELTRIYYRNLLNDYIKLIDNISINHKTLVNHLYQRYELENIKVILRTICYERSKKEAFELLFPLDKYQTVSIDRLLDSKDLLDFIDRLKDTWYYDPLDNSSYRFEKEGETFPLEIALDLRYYARLWEIVSSLKRDDQKNAKSLIGIQLDALNILWIIRFKESYRFSPEEILNYSLTNGSFITPKKRKRLAYSIDQRNIINNLNGTPYNKLLNEIDDPEIAYTVLLQYIFYQAKKNWIANPFQIGIILDYLFFKEIEVRNLITITEARKIGLSTEKMNGYLIELF
ncbi:MAG: V-type ATPase subunit [bacterium]